MASWSDVRRIALGLPGASEGTAFGSAAWSANKKLLVWERPLRKSDLAALGGKAPKGPILGVRTADLEMKDVLLASDPKIFFTTPRRKRLRDVIEEAWLSRAGKRGVMEYLRENQG